MYLHNRDNFEYDSKPVADPKFKTQLLTVGELVAEYGPKPKVGAVLAFGPYKPRVILDDLGAGDTDASEETEGFDDFETRTGILMDGQYNTYVTPEAYLEFPQVKVSNSRKRYAFFDEPRLRSCSDIIAELQDSAVPLEQEIQFERTRMNTGKREGNQFLIETEFRSDGSQGPCRNYRVQKFGTEKCYVHKDIAGYEVEVEDLSGQ